ncbi:signal peptidase I [Halosimplex rubrum]|uniref:Signal peptidase I n=1 Tax=Halosimplex rubrum TaxID=869889 RepID=A0A7D5T9Z0_9EURY|nr:signal peptidase I [Halosimplex rubrum]
MFGAVLLVTLVSVAGVWKTFEKAGQPGWAAVVPVYNVYVLVAEIADRDILWVLLSIFVPIAAVIPMIDVAKAFGKGTGYGVGLAFLGFVFFPLLGFGDARYRGASPY